MASISRGKTLVAEAPHAVWRVRHGVLRVDAIDADGTRCFLRLAWPGDLVGVEQRAAPGVDTRARALVDSSVEPLCLGWAEHQPWVLLDAIGQMHRRTLELSSLRSGPTAERVRRLLLLLAAQGGPAIVDSLTRAGLPGLKDMADILDAAPETISRVISGLRRLRLLEGGEARHEVELNPRRLQQHLMSVGMTASTSRLRTMRAAATAVLQPKAPTRPPFDARLPAAA